jgi:hypothetical protein
MQVRLGTGSEQLVAEQKREIFRIHVVVSRVRYDAHERRASMMK